MTERVKRIRVPDLREKKRRGQKIAMLTAYDAAMARLLDKAGVDVLLVGDSVGMVVLGYDTTLPVTLEAMIHHTAAVARGTKHALVVADMPFMTYHASVPEALRNAGRLMQEGGAHAVKIEGGRPVIEATQRLVEAGIPVMGHLGLLPQSVHQAGGFRQQARSKPEAERLVEDAKMLQEAGIFALVLEHIPAELARVVTRELSVPTIGIGAGPYCDGQVLVSYDALGFSEEYTPPFVKQYAKLGEQIIAAAKQYAEDVRDGRFPLPEVEAAVTPNGSK